MKPFSIPKKQEWRPLEIADKYLDTPRDTLVFTVESNIDSGDLHRLLGGPNPMYNPGFRDRLETIWHNRVKEDMVTILQLDGIETMHLLKEDYATEYTHQIKVTAKLGVVKE